MQFYHISFPLSIAIGWRISDILLFEEELKKSSVSTLYKTTPKNLHFTSLINLNFTLESRQRFLLNCALLTDTIMRISSFIEFPVTHRNNGQTLPYRRFRSQNCQNGQHFRRSQVLAEEYGVLRRRTKQQELVYASFGFCLLSATSCTTQQGEKKLSS